MLGHNAEAADIPVTLKPFKAERTIFTTRSVSNRLFALQNFARFGEERGLSGISLKLSAYWNFTRSTSS